MSNVWDDFYNNLSVKISIIVWYILFCFGNTTFEIKKKNTNPGEQNVSIKLTNQTYEVRN